MSNGVRAGIVARSVWGGARVNKRERRIIAAATAIIVLMALFPPWTYTFSPPGAARTENPAGYAFLMTPPPPESSSHVAGVGLDVTRLALQIGIVALISGGLLVFRRRV